MIKLLTFFVLAFFVLLWIKYPKSVYYLPPTSEAAFQLDSILDKIEYDIVDLTSTSDLIDNITFINLCTYAQVDYKQFIKILERSDISEQRKIILIMAAHTLPDNQFIEFFKIGCNLYVENKLSKNELMYLLVPGNTWNNRPFVYFYKPEIRASLRSIKNSQKKDKEVNEVVNRILLGQLTILLYFQ